MHDYPLRYGIPPWLLCSSYLAQVSLCIAMMGCVGGYQRSAEERNSTSKKLTIETHPLVGARNIEPCEADKTIVGHG